MPFILKRLLHSVNSGIFILTVTMFSFAQGAEQHERIYSYPPSGIETTKEVIPLVSKLKK